MNGGEYTIDMRATFILYYPYNRIRQESLVKEGSQDYAQFQRLFHQYVGAHAVAQKALSSIPQPCYQDIDEA
jgi:hypothetical protein